MMVEEAWVTKVEPGRVWVEKPRRSACSGCRQTCASALVAGFFVNSAVRFPITTDLALQVGDRVEVGLPEGALVLGALGIYLLPLISLLIGALLGQALGMREGGTIVGAGLGFFFGFVGLRATGWLKRIGLHPVIVKKIS